MSIVISSTRDTMAKCESQPQKLPRVVNFGFIDYKLISNKDNTATRRTARCKFCQASVAESLHTTSNFVRHLKIHREKYNEYKELKKEAAGTGTLSNHFNSDNKFPDHHIRQHRVTQSIIEDLIIGCAVPLSIIDNPAFLRFMTVMDGKWQSVSVSYLMTWITSGQMTMEEGIKKRLAMMRCVSTTVDVWCDGKDGSGYLAVTAHGIVDQEDRLSMESYLLNVQRLTGTGISQRIGQSYATVCEAFHIASKLNYIINDPASYMKAAFSVCFPNVEETTAGEQTRTMTSLDDEAIWNDVDSFQLDGQLFSSGVEQRLHCFTHALQLTVKCGLTETTCIKPALNKCSQLVFQLSNSNLLKEELEKVLSYTISIPAQENGKQWISAYGQIVEVLKFPLQQLNYVLNCVYPYLVFTADEWNQLTELVHVLSPLVQALEYSQADKVVSVSIVAPSVISLYNHLKGQIETCNHLKHMAVTLQNALRRNFAGILRHVGLAGFVGDGAPFSSNVYIIAAVLDPLHSTKWLSPARLDMDEEKAVLMSIQHMVLDAVKAENPSTSKPTADCDFPTVINMKSEFFDNHEPPLKLPKLFSYISEAASSSASTTLTPTEQYAEYLDIVKRDGNTDGMLFWSKYKSRLNLLYNVAVRVLGLPASSTAVEKVFARGGMVSQQGSVSDKTLCNLIFIKCNKMYGL